MAPFVQLAPTTEKTERDRGKASTSASLGYSAGYLFGPYGSGGFSWWFRERYSLAFASLSTGMFAQGNLELWNRGLSLGVVHGVGVGFHDTVGVYGAGTAGLFVQSSSERSAAFYGGIRGTTLFVDFESFIDLSLGWMKRINQIQLGPEVRLDPLDRGPTIAFSFQLEANF